MKKPILFVLFSISVLLAAGCGGSNTAFAPNSSTAAGADRAVAPDSVGTPAPTPTPSQPPFSCVWWCFPQPIVPLAYNGTSFSVAAGPSCWDIFNPPVYQAPSSGPLTLSGPVTLPQTCLSNLQPWHKHAHGSKSPQWYWPSQGSYELYIVGAQIPLWLQDNVGKHLRERPQDFGDFVSLVAGPTEPNSNPWIFEPLSPGLTFQAHASYVFYVVALVTTATPPPTPTPAPTFPPSDFTPIAPVSFSGSGFTNVSAPCIGLNLLSGPEYVPTSQYAFNVSGDPAQSLTPQCAPSNSTATGRHRGLAPETVATPTPTPLQAGQLYIIGYDVTAGAAPVVVMGPVSASTSPWVFQQAWPVPLANVGDSYTFYIAVYE